MKYFEFVFRTHPCTETVNDVLAAVLGEAGFESFMECEGGLTAYIQQSLCDETSIKMLSQTFHCPIQKSPILTLRQKTRTGMKNGKRISSNRLLSETGV